MNRGTYTHLERTGCLIDYMEHTKCGETVSTRLIANGRPTCPHCYEIYFRDLMALHASAVASGVVRAAK